MNAYKLTVSGETEYLSGTTAIEALKMYCDTVGLDVTDFDDSDDFEEIPISELDTIIVKNMEYSEGEDEKEQYTLKELLDEHCGPSILASSMY